MAPASGLTVFDEIQLIWFNILRSCARIYLEARRLVKEVDRYDEHLRLLLASLEDWKSTILAKSGLYWARRISEYSCINEWKTRDMASTFLLIGP